tara:strand:- start:3020 stop:3391 length:372 start_codon:yes stop_codon:yes gene_type:complete
MFSGDIPYQVSDAMCDHILEHMHVDLGGEMAVLWNMPEFLSNICMEHHTDALDEIEDDQNIHIVRVVSGVNEMRANPRYRIGLEQEVLDSMVNLGMNQSELRSLMTEIRELAEMAENMIEFTS